MTLRAFRLTKRNFVIATASLLVVASGLSFMGVAVAWPVVVSLWILVPGFISYACLSRSSLFSLTSAAVAFGLGLSQLIVLGLLVNSYHWVFGISHPLTKGWLICTLLLCNALLLLYLMFSRRVSFPDIIIRLKLSRPQLLSAALCSCLLILVYFGVNRLNNTGDSSLLAAATLLVCLLPILAIYARKRLATPGLLIILFSLSLALLLGSSLRSTSLFGSDVINEFRVFELTNAHQLWSTLNISNTYNLCLSITILPQVLHILTNESGVQLFKIVFQAIFSICPLIIFLIARRYLRSEKAWLAAILFTGFSNYIGSMPNHIRQEVAFLFFSLIILMLVTTELTQKVKKVLLIVFGVSMILSHYSTSYVALLILLAYIILYRMLRLYYSMKGSQLAKPALTSLIFMILVVFTTFWYSQLTPSSGGPSAYIQSVVHSLTNGDENLKAENTGLNDQFKLSQSSDSNKVTYNAFIASQQKAHKSYLPAYVAPPQTSGLDSQPLDSILSLATGLIKKFYKLLVLASIAVVFFAVLIRGNLKVSRYGHLVALATACATIVAVSFVLPSFSVDYDQERFFQQLLVVLCVPAVVVWFMVFRGRLLRLGYYSLALFMSAYLLTSSGLASQFVRNLPLSAKFNNNGLDYGRYYVRQSELYGAQWAATHRQYRGVYADTYGSNRVRLASPKLEPQQQLSPDEVPADSFIYFYYPNVVAGQTYLQYKGVTLIVTPPTGYYEQAANKIYSNEGSVVYAN